MALLPFVALDAAFNFVLCLALAPGQFDAIDAAVAGVDEIEIVDEAAEEPGAAGGVRTDSVALHGDILFIIIIGGLASIRGAFFGAALIVVFPLVLSRVGSFLLGDLFDSGVLDMSQRIVLGTLIIVFLIAEPAGLVALSDRLKRRWFRRA